MNGATFLSTKWTGRKTLKVLYALILHGMNYDTSFGITWFIILSSIASAVGVDIHPTVIILSIFCVHAPDADFIPLLFLHKRFRVWGHWIVGHYPILVLPLSGMLSYKITTMFASQQTPLWIAGLCTEDVIFHFLHDSREEMGFHWFAPITDKWHISFIPTNWAHYSVLGGNFRRVPQEVVDEAYAHIRSASEGGGARDEITSRTEGRSYLEIITFCGVCFIATLKFLY